MLSNLRGRNHRHLGWLVFLNCLPKDLVFRGAFDFNGFFRTWYNRENTERYTNYPNLISSEVFKNSLLLVGGLSQWKSFQWISKVNFFKNLNFSGGFCVGLQLLPHAVILPQTNSPSPKCIGGGGVAGNNQTVPQKLVIYCNILTC